MEREGFEPPMPFNITVFKTVAFNRSAISPSLLAGAARSAGCADVDVSADVNFAGGLCRHSVCHEHALAVA